ncbi:C-type lectin domain family 7 member A-like [Girardinichthys multiradiatus]|uniref:C-type lectin domain family 7 member A-like n=1 Tax=Girardinichthys multiradiatus TaxID=208333 RepID=UPI001FAB50CC|nr:C-type lectin domain family 7 member A-like [Girardinichthys multiradiatus]
MASHTKFYNEDLELSTMDCGTEVSAENSSSEDKDVMVSWIMQFCCLKDNNRPVCSSSRLLPVSVGILCVLLLVSFGLISWGSWEMKQQEKDIRRHTELLDIHSQTLKYMLSFDTFPVNEYCPDQKCQLCPKGWMSFNKSCYLFSDDSDSKISWEQSQRYCQNRIIKLFGIMNLQEQVFLINQQTTDYYWLRQQNTDNMILGDGHNYTLGFWIDELDSTGSYTVIMYVWLYHTKSWSQATPANWTKVICEQEAFEVHF